MKNLKISKEGESALVPYTGDGVVVPYEAFEPVKKRRPRPKVDLDPETNRLWNLLMGIEGSENAETMDEDKQKRWEEDRRVFRGRVDSFIARMHLVQGIISLNLPHQLHNSNVPITRMKICFGRR